MKKRKKSCSYCGATFYPKRIDAKYCTASCRGMGNRRKLKPDLYIKAFTIHIELEQSDFNTLHVESKRIGFKPNEYAKSVLIMHLNN